MFNGVAECCNSMCKPALFECLIARDRAFAAESGFISQEHTSTGQPQTAGSILHARQTDDLSLCGAAIMDQTAVRCLRCEV